LIYRNSQERIIMKNHFYLALRSMVCGVFIIMGTAWPVLAQVGVPSVINYQGRLYDPALGGTGGPLTGVQQVQFRIWDSLGGGTLIWGREFPVSCTDQGVFNVLISDGGTWLGGVTNHLPAAFLEQDRYLELTVVGYGNAISPRQQLVSAPYAMQSAYALDASQASDGFIIQHGLDIESGGMTVAGAVELDNTLNVTGAATFVGAVHLSGDLTVEGPATIAGFGTIPIGGIIMWSGSAASIPDGWALCDGGTHEGRTTPNLLDRFIVGAGDTYPYGHTGGAAEVALTVAEMPAHSHSISVHTIGYVGVLKNNTKTATAAPDESHNSGTQTRHTQNAGEGDAHENRPPYYALSFIMRVK
jgi:microcystin-dependent protein